MRGLCWHRWSLTLNLFFHVKREVSYSNLNKNHLTFWNSSPKSSIFKTFYTQKANLKCYKAILCYFLGSQVLLSMIVSFNLISLFTGLAQGKSQILRFGARRQLIQSWIYIYDSVGIVLKITIGQNNH